MDVTLTRVTENPMLAIEEAASNCYDSEPTVDGRIAKHCYDSGHHSVLEFADFTFHIEGVSRALLAQLTRHRIASFAVRSQRYCSENGFQYITPLSIEAIPELREAYDALMRSVNGLYTILQENGVPNEDARMILPNACETVIELKMNGRELIHFMNERLCAVSQWEIRQLANLMKCAIQKHNEQCAQFSEFLVPKCESGKIKYCPEGSKKTCGRQLLAEQYKELLRGTCNE